MFEVLYKKKIAIEPEGYNKIAAIKEKGWLWTEKERDEAVFGILELKNIDKGVSQLTHRVNEAETDIEPIPEGTRKKLFPFLFKGAK